LVTQVTDITAVDIDGLLPDHARDESLRPTSKYFDGTGSRA
jgi:hypothetical protein